MSEIMGTAGLDLWGNRIRHGSDGADATGSCYAVWIIVASLYKMYVL